MTLKTLKAALLAAACAQTAMLAHAAEPAIAAHTELKDCVIQEVLPGKNMTGAFVRFVHHGAPVELVRVEMPSVSPRIELHSMKMKDGVMEMARMTDLKLSEGERRFRKGGDHVMLFDIAQNPAISSTHTMTVYFSDSTQAHCQAVVKSVREVMKDAGIDAAPAHDHNHDHGHKH